MYTQGECLSLFLKTTQSVNRNWVVSGLVVHMARECRLITANTVTHISRPLNNLSAHHRVSVCECMTF